MAQKLGEVASGTTVKLNLGGEPYELIIVQQGKPESGNYDDSCDGTWLMMKNVYIKTQFDTSGGRIFAYSSLFNLLNTEFLKLFDPDIRDAIKNVKIPYTTGGSNVNSGANGLPTKIFILSPSELNINIEMQDIPHIGAALDYFDPPNPLGVQATYDGQPCSYWSSATYYSAGISVISSNGAGIDNYGSGSGVTGVRPTLIISPDLYVLSDGTVTNNQPPTAPGSIDVSGVVHGGSATITLTAATDPDGTVASYIYERQVDGDAWQQVAQANSLTQTDTIGEEWATVAYRACAVDDKGVSGPYVTGETFTVNSGWVTIGGPAEDMGSQPRQFNFDFSVSVSGVPSVDAIAVSAALDGGQIYSGTTSAGEQISVPIDTRLLGAGQHVIEVQASKDDYLPASKRYTFTVPAVVLPDGGVGALAQGPDGRAVYHTTLAQRCIGTDGVDIQAQVDALTARVKILEG